MKTSKVSFYENHPDLEARQKYADALIAQGIQPLEQKTIGGVAIANSPMEGLAKLAQGLMGGYMQRSADQDMKDKLAQAQSQRQTAMAAALGRPAETKTYSGGNTINWDEQKPDMARAMGMLTSPENEDLATALMGNQLDEKQAAAKQKFDREQQQALFGQQKELADMTAQRQQAMQDSMLDRQMAMEKYKNENDPLRQIFAGSLQNTGQNPSDDLAIFNAALSAKGIKAPDGMMFNRQMQPVPNPNAKLTDEQAKAAGFFDRMNEANSYLGNEKISGAVASPWENAKDVPLVGNYLTSSAYQQGDQAKRDFVNALLRRESGAAISPSEFESANKQYFPRPGDSPEVLAQKAQNRITAMEGIKRSAGPAAQSLKINEPKKSGIDIDAFLKEKGL